MSSPLMSSLIFSSLVQFFQVIVNDLKIPGHGTSVTEAQLVLSNNAYNWLKCGTEYVDGRYHASVVVTVNGWSDWSLVPLEKPPSPFRLRVKREREAIHVEYGEGENGPFKIMRLAYLPLVKKTRTIMVGIMCASPNEESDGFDVIFDQLNITKHS
ncbi:unnamed protein product [Rotaria socialis]|uniref:Uncharacterized protein n=1 Tax=Rotaria socialis TaxID=392032 RepID=A0A818AIX4_9BILA|nr:unnamed protein product [Rotaria socialis]